MTQAKFTFDVDEDLKAAFGNAARADSRDAPEVLRALMRDYIESRTQAAEYDDWFRRKVTSAIVSADAGDLLSGDDVEAEFTAMREQAMRSSSE
jgi:predicted transcriptional regulator